MYRIHHAAMVLFLDFGIDAGEIAKDMGKLTDIPFFHAYTRQTCSRTRLNDITLKEKHSRPSTFDLHVRVNTYDKACIVA